MAKIKTTKGHCFCRALEYEFEGEPLWVAHCHCESCRRATSSAFATYVGVKLDHFRYLKGTPSAFESSPGVQRFFCGVCGSPMAYHGKTWPGEVHLHAGSLADPAHIEPKGHVNVAEQLPWADIHDALPRFERFSAGKTPVRRGPKS
jgi:hypothetical protein